MGSQTSPVQTQQLLAKSGTILFDFPVPPTDVTDENGMNKVENVMLAVLRTDFGKCSSIDQTIVTG